MYQKPKNLIQQLGQSLKELRRLYARAVQEDGRGAFEWIRDNYYLLKRDGENTLRELKKSRFPKRARIAILCREAAMSGEKFEDSLRDQLAALSTPLSTCELEYAGLVMKAAFINLCAEGGREESAAKTGAAVRGLRELPAFDGEGLIEAFSPMEKLLREDPAGVYCRMTDESRAFYRRRLRKLSRKTGMDEAELANKILDDARTAEDPRKRHVGYWLLEANGEAKTRAARGKAFLWLRALLPALLSVAVAFWLDSWWSVFLFFLPLYELLRPLLDFFALLWVPPDFLPRLKLEEIPEAGATLIVVSALAPAPNRAERVCKELERILYTAGKGNVRVCLLADLKEARSPQTADDKLALSALAREIRALNLKHGEKFIALVRNRSYVATQKAFSGWERKRGAITQLISVIRGESVEFALAEGDLSFLPTVQYIMALDGDTRPLLGSVRDLVSVALHPMNRPVFDSRKGRVVKGYGILAPRVETDLEAAAATPFSRVTCGTGGVSVYDAGTGEFYQDLFAQGIFAGKGLIDVEAFSQCLLDSLPKERILSHDILEGAFLRCGYVSDVQVTDGCPTSARAYLERLHRWIRGDWQNIGWLFKTVPGGRKNPLSGLSRHMLLDNLRRSLTPVFSLFCLIAALFPLQAAPYLVLAAMLGTAGPSLFSAFYSFVSGGVNAFSRKYYSKAMPAALTALAQALLFLSLLVQTAYRTLDAVFRTLWRLGISKQNLLEWVTAADSERKKNSFWKLLAACWFSLLMGALLLLKHSSIARLMGLFALACPFVMWLTGRKSKPKTMRLSDAERNSLLSFASSMWRYYADLAGPRDHFLPPDNLQEAPVRAVAHRTSPTNIGLMLLCTLAARDLGFIDTATLCQRVASTLDTVEKLEQYKGNLLNWYDTRTLEPLKPRFVSTVDSGNFACCLVALQAGLSEYVGQDFRLDGLCRRIRALVEHTDLTVFYNVKRKLFHIGYDLETGKLSESFYDLLMSESRMTSYFSVATGQVPKKHYGALGRTLAREGGYAGPVSWTGTMFEYFMPALLLPVYENSLSYEALRFCVFCQINRARRLGKPFGCSESGFYAFDAQFNYQYKAHGVAKLGMKRRLNSEFVVSPYSSFLCLQAAPRSALKNLDRLKEMDMTGRYGFYEAVDFTPARVGLKGYAIVRSYMAHHVGMSLLSVCNVLQDNVMQRRFMSHPQMEAARELLEEKIPVGAAVFEDVVHKQVPEKPGRIYSSVEEMDLINPADPRVHILSNGEWTTHLTDSGTGFSAAMGLDITRRSRDLLRRPLGFFAVVKSDDVLFSITRAPVYGDKAAHSAEFARQYAAFYAEKGPIHAGMRVTVHKTSACEQRQIVIKNTSGQKRKVRVLCYCEPSLAKWQDDSAHPAFSKLFLSSRYDPALRALHIARRPRDGEGEAHLYMGLADGAPFLYETARERLLSRPYGVSSLFSAAARGISENNANSLPDLCAAIEVTLEIPPRSSKGFSVLLCAASTKEEAGARLAECRNWQSAKEAASAPLFDSGLESRLAAEILPALYYPVRRSRRWLAAVRENRLGVGALWKMGISGDLPVVLIHLKNAADISRAEPYLRMQKQLRSAGLRFDLAALYSQGGEYSRPMSEGILEYAEQVGSAMLIGQKGGIHLVDQMRFTPEEIQLLTAASAYLVPDSVTSIRHPAPDFFPVSIRPVQPKPAQEAGEKVEGGVFISGGFVLNRKPALPWCNLLQSGELGTLLSDQSPGFTWYGNARENKLTPWYNDSRTDNRGELLLLRVDGAVYDLCAGAKVTFSPDFALYEGIAGPVEYRCCVTAQEGKKKLEIAYTSSQAVPLTFAFYTETVLGVNRDTARFITGAWDHETLALRNPYNTALTGELRLSAKGGELGYICDRNAFFGGRWHERSLLPLWDPCGAVTVSKTPRMGEKGCVEFTLSFVPDQPREALPAASGSGIRIQTPDRLLNHMFNTWLPHQVENGRIRGRTGFWQCGGAFGFRDQLQDSLAAMYWNPALTRALLIKAAAHQFPEGDVLHWWHELEGGDCGVRTRCSDDKLWLVYAACAYALVTGDTGIFDEQVPFITGEPLKPGEQERYFTPGVSEETASLFDHCVRAVSSVGFGRHGLPLIGNGDWNDGFSRIGHGGEGESVWLAQFFAIALERLAAVAVNRGETGLAREYLDRAAQMKAAVDQAAYQNGYYVRAFWDDGTPLGVPGSGECEMDLLPQAFAQLSGMENAKRVHSALDHAAERLIDRKYKMARLFTPAFHGKSDPGYIAAYPPGVRENGGQYTHAAVWLALAMFRSGRKAEGYALLRMLSPAVRSTDPQLAERYGLEPYFIAADIYAAPGSEGRGGWSLYTGAAGWYYQTVLTGLLGLQLRNGGLIFSPNLPDDWMECRLSMELRNTSLEILVKQTGQPCLTVDGRPATLIPLDGQAHQAVVTF